MLEERSRLTRMPTGVVAQYRRAHRRRRALAAEPTKPRRRRHVKPLLKTAVQRLSPNRCWKVVHR